MVNLNEWHQKRISKLLTNKLFGSLFNKIVVLGFAFKSNTNDTRESAAIQICKDLLEEGAFLEIHDPKVSFKQISIDLKKEALVNEPESLKNQITEKAGQWSYQKKLDDIFFNADAILILTEWDEYKKLNWQIVSNKMRKPAWVFDARSILNPKNIKDAGLLFWRIEMELVKKFKNKIMKTNSHIYVLIFY